jgi:hypothetical protein
MMGADIEGHVLRLLADGEMPYRTLRKTIERDLGISKVDFCRAVKGLSDSGQVERVVPDSGKQLQILRIGRVAGVVKRQFKKRGRRPIATFCRLCRQELSSAAEAAAHYCRKAPRPATGMRAALIELAKRARAEQKPAAEITIVSEDRNRIPLMEVVRMARTARATAERETPRFSKRQSDAGAESKQSKIEGNKTPHVVPIRGNTTFDGTVDLRDVITDAHSYRFADLSATYK